MDTIAFLYLQYTNKDYGMIANETAIHKVQMEWM